MSTSTSRKQSKSGASNAKAQQASSSTEPTNVSSVQSSGACVYKDLCRFPGQTLHNCVSCGCRFHHLCGSQVGGSDDMNLCRENCDGTRPDAKPKDMPEAPGAFVPTRQGVSMDDDDDDDDDDDHTKKSDECVAVSDDDAPLDILGSSPPTTPVMPRSSHASRLRLKGTAGRATMEDSPAKGRSGVEAPQSGPAAKRIPFPPAQKQPKPVPVPARPSSESSSQEDSDDYFYRVGNRPSVNPNRINHRFIVLPLFENEPVVFLLPEDETRSRARKPVPLVGVTSRSVERMSEPVFVRRQAVGSSQPEDDKEHGPLSLRDNMVVKQTDYVIYCGSRYCVFGPPLKSFCGVGWGVGWLDLLGSNSTSRTPS